MHPICCIRVLRIDNWLNLDLNISFFFFLQSPLKSMLYVFEKQRYVFSTLSVNFISFMDGPIRTVQRAIINDQQHQQQQQQQHTGGEFLVHVTIGWFFQFSLAFVFSRLLLISLHPETDRDCVACRDLFAPNHTRLVQPNY